MKRLFIMAALFFAAAVSAAESLRASLLFSFSPESQVEFVRGKPQLHSVSGGKVLLAQITRQYSRSAAEKGGEKFFDVSFKALTDGKLLGISVENQRVEDHAVQGFHPVTVTEFKVDGRDLLDGKPLSGGANTLRIKKSGMKLEAGKTYQVQARIVISSEDERRYGAPATPIEKWSPNAMYAVLEFWSPTPSAVSLVNSPSEFIKTYNTNWKERKNHLCLSVQAKLDSVSEPQVTVKVRANAATSIRTKFRVSGKFVNERGIRREISGAATLTSLKCNGDELLKAPVSGDWYTWSTPEWTKLVKGKTYTFVFTIRPPLPDASAVGKPVFAADFSAASGKTLRPIFGINERRSMLVTERMAKTRAEQDRAVGYNLRRLSNVDMVTGGRRAGDVFRIFGVFEADAADPKNYYFKATDDFLAVAKKSDIPIVYSLAPTVEYSRTHYRTGEPDRAQFVKVCAGIIRHYNEKWADGFEHDIRRWEIWNEPDSRDYWAKSVEEFGNFYAEVASELKKRFPKLEFGGPSFAEFDEKNFRAFLGACREAKAPLDFFSFKCSGPDPVAFARQVHAAKRLLEEYGYPDTPVIISEYNYNPLDKTVLTRNKPEELEFLDEDPAGLSGSDAGAAAILGAILWQDTPLESACIYGFARHREMNIFTGGHGYGMLRGGIRAVLPLYSEFFRGAAPESPVRVSAASENLGILGAVDRETGDGLLLLTALRDPRSTLRLRLGGVADGTKLTVRLWPAPVQRPGVNDSRPDYQFRNESVFVRKGAVMLPKFNDSMVWLIRIPKTALTAAKPAEAVSAEATPSASADFAKIVGKFKRLHGVNIIMPMEYEHDAARCADLGKIGFDTVRVHDLRGQDSCAGMAGDYQNIFPNYHADPNDPANYNFGPTDTFMRMVRESSPGTNFTFGLAPTIENYAPNPTKYWVVDPGNHDRFADLCIGIIRHYDKGWANGFEYGVRYYEIWNEPNSIALWDKSYEEFCRFYAHVAKRIKAGCPWIRIGGPALTKPDLKLVKQFVEICREENAPIDFFSWHRYPDNLADLIEPVKDVRRILDENGYKHTELHLNEWRLLPYSFSEFRSGNALLKMQDLTSYGRNGVNSAAFVVTALARMQDSAIDMSNFYSYGNGQWALYDLYGRRQLNWYAHKVYADFIRACGEKRVATSDQGGDKLAVLGGIDADGNKYLLISAYGEPARSISVKLAGVPASGGVKVTVLDAVRKLETFSDCYENGVLKLEKDAGGTVFLVKFDK